MQSRKFATHQRFADIDDIWDEMDKEKEVVEKKETKKVKLVVAESLNRRENQKKKEKNELRSIAFIAPKKQKKTKGKKNQNGGKFLYHFSCLVTFRAFAFHSQGNASEKPSSASTQKETTDSVKETVEESTPAMIPSVSNVFETNAYNLQKTYADDDAGEFVEVKKPGKKDESKEAPKSTPKASQPSKSKSKSNPAAKQTKSAKPEEPAEPVEEAMVQIKESLFQQVDGFGSVCLLQLVDQMNEMTQKVQMQREELDAKEQEIENYKQLLAALQRENTLLKKKLAG